MRFMILVKADPRSEAGVLPDEKLLTEMGKYNEELAKAGVLIAGEGFTQVRKARGSGSRATRGPSSTDPFPRQRTSSLAFGYGR